MVNDNHDRNKIYKEKMVLKGFLNKKTVDYNEKFSLVVKMTTLILVLVIIDDNDMHLEQIDIRKHSCM